MFSLFFYDIFRKYTHGIFHVMSDESENLEVKEEDSSKLKTELLDSTLMKALGVSIAVYFISYTFFSLLFGNTVGGFIATPLTAVSLFLTARWDRLRESKEISLNNVRNIFNLVKISYSNIFLSILFIFVFQFVSGYIVSSFDTTDVSPEGYSGFLEYISCDCSLSIAISFFILMYLSFLVGGYFSARLALGKSIPPYRHAVLGSFSFFTLSSLLTMVMFSLEGKEFKSVFFSEEVSIGYKILDFSQFILMPLIGAKIAVVRHKIKETERIKKAEENAKKKQEFDKLVTSEIERLKPKEG